jgi:excisionase family DNA binding protein
LLRQSLFTNQAAQILGLSPERVRQLEKSGKLPATRIGHNVRVFDPRDVDELRKRRAKAKQAKLAG